MLDFGAHRVEENANEPCAPLPNLRSCQVLQAPLRLALGIGQMPVGQEARLSRKALDLYTQLFKSPLYSIGVLLSSRGEAGETVGRYHGNSRD